MLFFSFIIMANDFFVSVKDPAVNSNTHPYTIYILHVEPNALLQ